MNLSARFQACTPREKALLGILGIMLLITGGVYAFPTLFGEKTTDTRPCLAPAVQPKQADITEPPPMQASSPAKIKNPFLVPPQYQARQGTTPPAPVAGPAPAQEPDGIVPVLSGIVARGTTKVAILELGGNSEPCGVGDALGGYTVASITDTRVVLHGPDGPRVLNIGR